MENCRICAYAETPTFLYLQSADFKKEGLL